MSQRARHGVQGAAREGGSGRGRGPPVRRRPSRWERGGGKWQVPPSSGRGGRSGEAGRTVALELLLNELGELRLVPLRVLLLEQLHVLRHMPAEDVLLVGLGVVLLAVAIVAREALLRVRDVEAAVHGALERTEHAVARRRAHKPNVEHAGERARAVLVLHEEHLTVRLLLPLVLLVELELLEETASAQQARRVARGVVRQPHLDAVLRQLV